MLPRYWKTGRAGFCVYMFELSMLTFSDAFHVEIVYAAAKKTFSLPCCCSPTPKKAEV